MPPVIALMTDFGLADAYVGIMKAVILGQCPKAQLLDLSHHIPPQNVLSGAYVLSTSVPFLPERSIVVAVVDPGVGSHRRAIAVRTDAHILIAPDNGLLSMVLDQHPARAVVELNNDAYHLTPVSHTFHGRDIFASCAAHLGAGANFEDLGEPCDPNGLIALNATRPQRTPQALRAHVVHMDHFGNLITDLRTDMLDAWRGDDTISIEVRDTTIPLAHTFRAVNIGQPVAYFGSTGFLELAVRDGHAGDHLRLKQGSELWIYRR